MRVEKSEKDRRDANSCLQHLSQHKKGGLKVDLKEIEERYREILGPFPEPVPLNMEMLELELAS